MMDNMPVSTKNIKHFSGMRTFIFSALVLWAIALPPLRQKPPDAESRKNRQRVVCIKSHS